MTTLFITAALVLLFVALALFLLGIGLWLTGKPKLEAGACGRDPMRHKKRDGSCGSIISCMLCDKREKKGNDSIQKR